MQERLSPILLHVLDWGEEPCTPNLRREPSHQPEIGSLNLLHRVPAIAEFGIFFQIVTGCDFQSETDKMAGGGLTLEPGP